VRDATWQASQKFLADIAPAFGTTTGDLVLVDGEVRSRSGKFEPVSFRRAASKMTASQISAQAKRVPDYDPKKYLTYGGVDVAEVEVDTELGRIHVKRVLSVHDCGRPMNPAQTISQINGGIIQGISYTLLENRLLDPVYGLMVNPDLEQYKIIGSREIPDIDVRLVEAYIGQSSTDASGIGEAAGVVSIGAAIGNAFYNATGVRVRRTPMTPDVVLAALRKPAQNKELA
jgi:xanthine dehydrogenase YagR molybdenum-binding subunit